MDTLDKNCLQEIANYLIEDPRDVKRFLCVNKAFKEIGESLWCTIPCNERLGSLILSIIKNQNLFKNIRIAIHCRACPVSISPSRVICIESKDDLLYVQRKIWSQDMDRYIRIGKNIRINSLKGKIYRMLEDIDIDEIIIWTKNGISENNKKIIKLEDYIYEIFEKDIRVYRFREIHHLDV